MSAPDGEPRWYTYDFPAKAGVRCGLRRCDERHPVVYVGKSNEPWRRHFEHLPKWWLPLTAGYRIHEQTYATEAECLAAEEAMIRGSCGWRPLANDVHNRDNPHRLVADAEAARHARRAPRRVAHAVSPARREWSRRQKLAAGLAAVWLALAVAGWVAALRLGAAALPALYDGVGAASALLLAGWLCKPIPRARRRTRARRKWALAVLAVAAVAVGWTLLPAGAKQLPAPPSVVSR